MQIQVKAQEYEELADWYSSKPKYPLHVNVRTASGLTACITGVKQYFYGEALTWQYQLTTVSSGKPITSWWSEADIAEVFSDSIDVDEFDDEECLTGYGLGGLEDVLEFVERYGQKALEDYHQKGVMRELRIGFWDAMSDAPSNR